MKKPAAFWFFGLALSLLPAGARSSPSFFKVAWKDGKAWFTAPSGGLFLSMGVNAVGDQSYRAPNGDYYNPVPNQYGGDKKAWEKAVFHRLQRWGFNTLGSWSDEDLLGRKFPFTYMLSIARGNPWDKVLDSVFTEGFEQRVKENAQKASRFRQDPFLIGYFLDNELPWWGEAGWKADGQKTLLEKYAASGVDDANKEALKRFLEERYHGDIGAFDEAWGLRLKSFGELEGPVTLSVKTRRQKAAANAWAGLVADRYFAVATRALRDVDPNHLILGVRFAGESPWEVAEACGRYCDVVSVNHYSKSGDADQTLMDNLYIRTGKPILITEYSFSAMDNQSGDPNTRGADVSVPTQKDRVERLDRFARQLLNLPYVVGLHWFEWADESPRGRFDGEDCDYGLVDIHDREYALLTREQARLNRQAASLHQKAEIPAPKQFTEPAEPDYRRSDEGVTVAPVRTYMKIDSTAHVDTWGDGANGGKAVANTTSGALVLDFESGTGWGCGASCYSNVGPFAATGPNVTDLRGYNFFDFKAFVPKGLNFTVYLTESGSGAPGLPPYRGVSDADGESYSFPALTGTGRWENYRVDLSELERRTSWGNQHGNDLLDLQALSDVEFYIPPHQGRGRMLVKDLEFKKL